jgi:hypothetical protein
MAAKELINRLAPVFTGHQRINNYKPKMNTETHQPSFAFSRLAFNCFTLLRFAFSNSISSI